ncbi:MAG: 30S ribosomal protein S20 [Treponema sp.]|nr:30S ribosomal protein S20 [Treponema sp.]
MVNKNSSAEKRYRQSEKRRFRNKSVKSAVKTSVKKFTVAVQKKEIDVAQVTLRNMISNIDSAAQKGIVTRNAASRKKSRMQKLFNTLSVV